MTSTASVIIAAENQGARPMTRKLFTITRIAQV